MNSGLPSRMMDIAALGLEDARCDHSRRRGEMSAGATTRGVSSRQAEKLVGKFDQMLKRSGDVLVDVFGEETAAVMRGRGDMGKGYRSCPWSMCRAGFLSFVGGR